MLRQIGFSLIELMVTCAIAAILATVAIPSYRDYVMRGSLVEAHNVLSDYRVRMEQFYQDNRGYDGAGLGGCGVAAPAAGSLQNFTLACAPGGGGQTYVLTATGNSGSSASGFTFTIDELNQRRTTAAASGWASSVPMNCWLKKKGSC